jgi:hypothetical protein
VVPPCLLDGLPYCQESKSDGEAGGQSGKLEVLDGSRHGVVKVKPKVGEGGFRSKRSQKIRVQGLEIDHISSLVPERRHVRSSKLIMGN